MKDNKIKNDNQLYVSLFIVYDPVFELINGISLLFQKLVETFKVKLRT
jgi:hypothetical protein